MSDEEDDNDDGGNSSHSTSPTVASRSRLSVTPSSEPPSSPSSLSPSSRETISSLEEYYQARYPSIAIPTPEQILRDRFQAPQYYTVTAGTIVGIFSDWSQVSPVTQGFRRNHQSKYDTFVDVFLAYREAYKERRVMIIDKGGDIARYGDDLSAIIGGLELGPALFFAKFLLNILCPLFAFRGFFGNDSAGPPYSTENTGWGDGDGLWGTTDTKDRLGDIVMVNPQQDIQQDSESGSQDDEQIPDVDTQAITPSQDTQLKPERPSTGKKRTRSNGRSRSQRRRSRSRGRSKQKRSSSSSSSGLEEVWEKGSDSMIWGFGFPWRCGYRATSYQVLKYIRKDFRTMLWQWTGIPNRDTSLDLLPDNKWAATQIYRCLPAARKHRTPPPTFTGDQVQTRLATVQKELDTVIAARAEMKKKRHEFHRETVRLDWLLATVKQQDQEARDDEHAPEQQETRLKEILYDLNDLEMIGLAWVHVDDPTVLREICETGKQLLIDSTTETVKSIE
ncbi:hypothetical protein V5O48_014362 [Marasmius crinis-equi]|uniref:Ribonuclease H1 N-terminal domain-containing protein n=1 Tax=Marasmius crinis-equi TaxID=585013 RepID=A0ABR3EXJ4_9AGAR